MTPRDAADFRIRGMLGWGGTLAALGVLLLGLAWFALPDGGNDATIFLVLALLSLVPGLVLLQVGLVAVGVRFGLAAHGVRPAADPD